MSDKMSCLVEDLPLFKLDSAENESEHMTTSGILMPSTHRRAKNMAIISVV